MEVCESKVHSRSSIILLLSSQYCSCVAWGLLWSEGGYSFRSVCVNTSEAKRAAASGW
jgi:hypothetical protein